MKNKKMQNLWWAALIIGAALFLYGCEKKQPEWVDISEEWLQSSETETLSESIAEGTEETDETDEENDEETESTGLTILYVYVCGAVNKPGVYELSCDSRIHEAVRAAGGFTADASQETINLAAKVKDGQQITILTKEQVDRGETIIADMSEQKTTVEGEETEILLVNINTATREELMTLPGIGEAKAEAIIAYRSNNGAFEQVEDIMLVSGIKESAFNKLQGRITVS